MNIGHTALFFTIKAIWLVIAVGWILNIVKIVKQISRGVEWTDPLLLLQLIGIPFAPLGTVLGFVA